MDDFQKKLLELEELGLDDPFDFGIDDDNSKQHHPMGGAKGQVINDALGSMSTYVDIVFCIDITQSMSPIISTIKNLALDLYDDLIEKMRERNNRVVKQLRVRVVAFRDYYCDGACAMIESDFFYLPDQKSEFRNFIASLQAKGGGDDPENALEAIALAMRSKWVKVTNPNTEKARHVVLVFTDASAHPLEKSMDGISEYYPSDMLKSYKELYEAWCGQGTYMDESPYVMDKLAERLIIFAPEDAYPWSDMIEDIDYAAFVPISAARGGIELGKETIIATIGGSMK